MNKKFSQWEDFPLLLTPRIIRETKLFPGGVNQLYGLFNRPDFPSVRHGRKLFVSRDAFRAWLEQRNDS